MCPRALIYTSCYGVFDSSQTSPIKIGVAATWSIHCDTLWNSCMTLDQTCCYGHIWCVTCSLWCSSPNIWPFITPLGAQMFRFQMFKWIIHSCFSWNSTIDCCHGLLFSVINYNTVYTILLLRLIHPQNRQIVNIRCPLLKPQTIDKSTICWPTMENVHKVYNEQMCL